ncbi:IS110 family transposase, partial [Tessaracoccus sp. HF-7]|nr:IS110 family transposase [Tessaracoccus caeni]
MRHGNKHLKAALGIAALSVTRTKNTYLAARFQRVKARRGGKRALVALQHTMITTIWHMATNGTYYQDPGTDYHDRQNPNRTRQRL